MKEFSHVVQDEVGIHARPAGMLVKEAKKFESKIIISKEGKTADISKLMALLSLGVKCGENVHVEITGADEEQAYESMKSFFEKNL